MTLQIVLNLVTMVMCIMTMALATAALAPQMKQAVVIVRDGLLWTVLFAVIGAVAFVGWGRFFKAYANQAAPVADAPQVTSEPRTESKVAKPPAAQASSRPSPKSANGVIDKQPPANDLAEGRPREPAFRANRSQ